MPGVGVGIGVGNLFRKGSKVNQKFALATADGSKTLSIYVKFPVGKNIIVNWGDGTSSQYAGAGSSNVLLSKNYGSTGIYPISLDGDWREITSIDCYNNSLSGEIKRVEQITKLVTLSIGINMFTGEIPRIGGDNAQALGYFALSNRFSSANLTTFRKAMTAFNISNQTVVFPTSEIDKLLLNLANYYQTNAPTANVTINMSGANMGIPTGGSSNADLTRLVGYYTAAGFTCNVLIRTS